VRDNARCTGDLAMRHCLRCQSEYRTGLSRCSDCGHDLSDGPLPETEAPPDIPVARLTRVSDPNAADVIRALLATEGIPAYVRRHGPISGELGRVTDGMTEDYALVMVPEPRLEEARRLLAELESGTVEWPEGMSPDEGPSEARES
jgi:hypothetical protein